MNVKQVMTSRNIDYLPPDASIQLAAKEMLKHDFGFVPIAYNNKLLGVVTDRDITIRAVANGFDQNAPVEKFMSKNVAFVHENDNLQEATRLMEDKKIRRLVVLNNKEQISGVLSLGDIATRCNNIDLSGEVITAISERY